MFRFKRSIDVEYREQGCVFFISRRYPELSAEKRKRIRELCREAGGAYHKAVLEYVTKDAEAVTVCEKHHISNSTLERAVRRYYTAFAAQLKEFGL